MTKNQQGYRKLDPILKEYFAYDPISGKFTWIQSSGKRGGVGTNAGTLQSSGYVQLQLKGIRWSADRVAWYLYYGEDPDNLTVDHKDRNKANNEITNLRLITQADQCSHQGALGYSWNPVNKAFCVATGLKGTHIYLGSTCCPLIARIAYHEYAVELFPHMQIPFIPNNQISGRPEPLTDNQPLTNTITFK